MQLAHKIRLEPNTTQEMYFRKACGTTRLVYNLALARWNDLYAAGDKPNGMALKKEFNAVKYEQYPWLKEIHRDAHSQPFADLNKAFSNFFRGTAKRPVFKKKNKSKDSFYVANDRFKLEDERINLPKIGWVKMRETLRFTGKVCYAVVFRKADHWYASIVVDVENPYRSRTADGSIGVDLGIKTYAALSDGARLQAPKALGANLKKLRRLSKSHSRKKPGSKNHVKSAMKLARLHEHISDIRNDYINKFTSKLCKENQLVVFEDLAVRNMIRNKKLARHIADMGWGETIRQVKYKCELFGSLFKQADRYYPSSQLHNVCGYRNRDLKLKDRSWVCPQCGVEVDRDVNAALNILTVGLTGIACGDGVRPLAVTVCEAGITMCSLSSTF